MKKDLKILKIGILSPYLDMLGGGEQYIFSIASALSRENKVYLYADTDIEKKSREIFNINLKRTHFLPTISLRTQNLFKRYITLRQYDLFIYMTDGSLFFSGAKKNLLIIQSPLHIPKQNLLNNLKLINWQIVCYSNYMKNIISQKLGDIHSIATLPPCINIPSIREKVENKQNIILSVGRFFPYPHDKKHAMLIDLFKAKYKKYFPDWKLIIAGGLTEKGGEQILTKLKSSSVGFPIEIMVNLSSNKLVELYKKAKIYWHATGFDENLAKYPEKAEHFGITPLEAMANGAVPVVYNAGGLKDIIKGNYGGYLWNTVEELFFKTYELINNEKLLKKKNVEARVRARDFSCDKFYERLEKIIAG